MSDRRDVLVLAACCGITASNVYLLQPIAVDVARHHRVDDATVGLLVSATHIAYALGIALFVPIIDHAKARTLLFPLVSASALMLTVMAAAPAWWVFATAACLLGLLCPIPQIIIPAAVGMSGERSGAHVIGVLQAGLLVGLLGARFYAGTLASLASTQVVFGISAVLTLGSGAFAVSALRGHRGRPDRRRLIPGVAFFLGLRLLRRPPRTVAWVCVSGLLLGVPFGMFWNSLTFLGDRWYQLDAAQIGMFGLVAAASGLLSPMAGRWADKDGPRLVQLLACLCVFAGWLSLSAAHLGVMVVVLATVLIDVGVWSNQVLNQATIFADRKVPRGLANTIYFTSRFLGISLGSAVGSTLFLADLWTTAVMLACASTACGLGVYLGGTRPERTR
ncbi:MFS transporter [Austwickia chelonae]|uniref:MFS transporter n=1 Tax=Austwickia chelonae TaxID=100225 RepID=UPI000E264F62|nr:MFS transporter [Austwickia chelonae]